MSFTFSLIEEGFTEDFSHKSLVADARINSVVDRIKLVDGLIGGRKRQKFSFAIFDRLDFESGITRRNEPPAKFIFETFSLHPRSFHFGKGLPFGERNGGGRGHGA